MTQAFKAKLFQGYGDTPEHVAFIEPTAKEIRVVFAGETVAKSRRAVIMHETKHLPVYYFPMSDVRMELLEPIERSTH